MNRWYRGFPFAVLLLVIAIVGSPARSSERHRPAPTVSNSTADYPFPPTLDALQDSIFTPICSVCHDASGTFGARLDSKDDAFNSLVGQPSAFCPGETRVIPFDPENSYIVKKLEGRAPCGDQMPLGDAPLPPEWIAVVREWIARGAMYEEPVPVRSVTWSLIKTRGPNS